MRKWLLLLLIIPMVVFAQTNYPGTEINVPKMFLLGDHTIGDGTQASITQTWDTIGDNDFTVTYTDNFSVIETGALIFGTGTSIVARSIGSYVRKDSPGTLNPGDLVYVSSYNVGTGFVSVELADADNAGARPAIGMVATTVTNNVEGRIVIEGRVSGFDTSGTTIGDPLYLSATPGLFTSTRPAGETASVQIIGRVLRAHNSMGIIQVGIQSEADIPNVNSANIIVGDSNGVPQSVAMTGDVTISNTGETTIVVLFSVESLVTFTKAQLEARISDVADIAEADGDVFTGAHDFGGANSIEIVNGSSPIVDAAGEIAIDLTSDNLVFFGAAERVIPHTFQFCEYLNGISQSSDDRPLWMSTAHAGGVTIVSAACVCVGTCSTLAELELENDSGSVASMTGTIDCETTSTGDTNTAIGGAAASVALGDLVRFDTVNNPSQSNSEYMLCVNYTVNAD